jgi:hypothetical protein
MYHEPLVDAQLALPDLGTLTESPSPERVSSATDAA